MIDLSFFSLDLLFKIFKVVISLVNLIFFALVFRNLVDRQAAYTSIMYIPFLVIMGTLGLFSVLFLLSALI